MTKNNIKMTEVTRSAHYSARYRTIPLSVVVTERYKPEGLPSAVSRFMGNRNYDFCGYIYLRKGNLIPSVWEKFCPEFEPEEKNIYYKSNIIGQMDFHCGCTYAEFEDAECIKIGCDWQHLHDEIDPTVDHVVENLMSVIDQLFETQEILCWNQKDGRYIKEEDGTYIHAGVLYPNDDLPPNLPAALVDSTATE